MSRKRKMRMTRRRFMQGTAGAAVGVGAGITVAVQPSAGRPDVPVFPFDDSTVCEILICTRDIPTSRWKDGDVVQAYSTDDALRVHAETIASGRSRYRGQGLSSLRTLYDEITDNRRVRPRRDDLLVWWRQAKKLAGLRSADFTGFPFAPIERRRLLVLPLEADVTPAMRQGVEDTTGFRQWRLSVDWRSAMESPARPSIADVLDPSVEVTFRRPFPLSIVTAELVRVPFSQER